MTPNDLEILIHCHVSPAPHPRADAPAVAEALTDLTECGLIILHKDSHSVYSTTDRGKAHIEVLCNMSLPEKKWIDPFGKIINI